MHTQLHTSLPKDLVRAIFLASGITLIGMFVFQCHPDAHEEEESRAPVAPVSRGPRVALGSHDAATSLALEERPERAQGRSAVRDPEAHEAAESTFGEVTIRVLARDGHAPVKGATVWTVPSHSEVLITGADGSVTFLAESAEILAGVESAHGYLRWDPKSDPDGVEGEGGSVLGAEVDVARGTSTEIKLFVRLGAVIRGSLVDANGAPVPNVRFGFASADGGQWSPGRRWATGDDGTFQIVGLAPGWYLVAPDPYRKEIFPYERVEAGWGSVHELTLEELPKLDTSIELIPEGIGANEPWPFSVTAWVMRDDQITLANPGSMPSELYRERSRSPGEKLKGPAVIQRGLREGPYRIQLTAKSAPGPAQRWLPLPWMRIYRFRVDAKGHAHFEDTGEVDRIVMKGMDNVAILDVKMSGPASRLRIWREVREPKGIFVSHMITEDPNGGRSLVGAIDLAELPGGKVHMYEQVRREPLRFMRTVELRAGLNDVAVQFLGSQEDR